MQLMNFKSKTADFLKALGSSIVFPINFRWRALIQCETRVVSAVGIKRSDMERHPQKTAIFVLVVCECQQSRAGPSLI